MEPIPYYRQLLSEELAKRLATNSRYSLRRYSQFFGIAPGALSQILSGSRSPSDRNVDRFFSKLELSSEQREEFLRSLLEEKRKSGKQRISRRLKSEARSFGGSVTAREHEKGKSASVGLDQFRIISDWYHYAIWEMVERPDFQPKASWLAKRLGITVIEAKLGFERLQNLELIERSDSRWRKTSVRLQTKDLTKTSEFHRKRQRQILEKAIDAVNLVPIEERHHSAITLNLDPDRIPEARERIQKFLWELAADLECGNPRQVYEIALQVFPLERQFTNKVPNHLISKE